MKTAIHTALLAVALTASTSFAGQNGYCPTGDAHAGYMQTSKGLRFSTNLAVHNGRYYASDTHYSHRNWEENRNMNRQYRDTQSSKDNRNNNPG